MTRTCGSCHECCIHVAVAAFDKPRGTPCQHLNVIQDCGCCGVYDQRPSECAAYRCSWLEGHLAEDLKPETSGILFETATIEWPHRIELLIGWEIKPGAVDANMDSLKASVRDGVVILVIGHDEQQTYQLCTERDAMGLELWKTNCQLHGGFTRVMADGSFEEKL
jgi:hypothetical protein